MKHSPVSAILRCLQLTQGDIDRILAPTEVESQVVVSFVRLGKDSDAAGEMAGLLDDIADFGETIKVFPDPHQLTSEDQDLRDFLVLAVIPGVAADSLRELFERPTIERFSVVAWDDREQLRQALQAIDNESAGGEENTSLDVLQQARSFILTGNSLAQPHRSHEPLPTRLPENLSAITQPSGFFAAGIRCGIKTSGFDLGLVVSDRPCRAVGRFTTNRFSAAQVKLCRERLPGDNIRGLVINSGNANAGTGERGEKDARDMLAMAENATGLESGQVVGFSTGVIGHFLPMDKIESGIHEAAHRLVRGQDEKLVQAMMTTDTVCKSAVRELTVDGQTVRLGGVTKGAGMIHPNMATMICFLTTDACVSLEALDKALGSATQETFNCLTVDGDTSPSDSVVLLANGAADNHEITSFHPAYSQFVATLTELCRDLSRQMARDGEGATHLVRVVCEQAFNRSDALEVAQTVATSLLVKTALFGRDPNWGRIVSAIGRTRARFDPDQVQVSLCGIPIFARSQPEPFDLEQMSNALAGDEIEILIRLGAGESSLTVYSCDLSYDYVRINADYHT